MSNVSRATAKCPLCGGPAEELFTSLACIYRHCPNFNGPTLPTWSFMGPGGAWYYVQAPTRDEARRKLVNVRLRDIEVHTSPHPDDIEDMIAKGSYRPPSYV